MGKVVLRKTHLKIQKTPTHPPKLDFRWKNISQNIRDIQKLFVSFLKLFFWPILFHGKLSFDNLTYFKLYSNLKSTYGNHNFILCLEKCTQNSTLIQGGGINWSVLIYSSLFRDYFYQFGELRSISMVPRQNCSFVCFTSRAAAETAAERSFNKLILKGRRLKIMWGKAQGQQAPSSSKGPADPTYAPVPGLPGGE